MKTLNTTFTTLNTEIKLLLKEINYDFNIDILGIFWDVDNLCDCTSTEAMQKQGSNIINLLNEYKTRVSKLKINPTVALVVSASKSGKTILARILADSVCDGITSRYGENNVTLCYLAFAAYNGFIQGEQGQYNLDCLNLINSNKGSN